MEITLQTLHRFISSCCNAALTFNRKTNNVVCKKCNKELKRKHIKQDIVDTELYFNYK